MTAVTWILAAIALVGTVLNIRQDRRCFYLWSVTNSGFAAVNFFIGQYAQALLFAIYFVLSLLGLRQWRRNMEATHAEQA